MADQAFHEIQLSGKHLVALFMAATVVAVVIFLCGVMVGRDIHAQRVALAQAAPDTPTDPTADVRSPDPTGTQPAAAGTSSSPAGEETLSYPERLSGSSQPAEPLKPAPAPAPAAVSTPEPVRESANPAVGRREPSRAPAAPPQGGSGFTVQVAAVGERGEADAIARRLSTKGYSAYVMPPASGSPRVFRVRVGKFADRREAEQVAERLRREEQFRPWITR